MRATVGPLPPAVYWRRRLVVLGAVGLVVLVVALSCSGGDDRSTSSGGAGKATPAPSAQRTVPPSDGPSFLPSAPVGGGGPKSVAATDVPAGPAATGAVVPEGTCADPEIQLVPVPSATTVKRGQSIDLRLKIKNVSARACSRDVGADLQEIYIRQGARKVWSSDVCGLARGSDVRELPPDGEREYLATWNGHDSTRCVGGTAVGAVPEPGEYEVVGRLGGKLSDPVRLSLTA